MIDGGRVTLRDGRAVEIRPLRQSDRSGLDAAVARLSEETRYLRFGTGKPHLTERELDFLLDVDHHRREAFLAVDPQTRRGVAVVRYVEIPNEPDAVEVAATVADDWQSQGLGGAMLAELAQRARDEGYCALRASVLATNHRSIAMLLRSGFRPHSTQGIMREYELPLDARPAHKHPQEHNHDLA